MNRIVKGDQNLELIRLHEKHGKPYMDVSVLSLTVTLCRFVRISYDEVSVSHPDAITKILLAPLHKVNIRDEPCYERN
jgi:hypothetical protein